ncbi:ABC transporter permease [Bacteroides sp. 51]|uniref:ABC transporter permease n=1 Tax=Bacteroides sp. 51 TaxID=2302938 RepID=UPI0013D10A39|nr:FtsX-like permease family protein [Bacteroides sp. 51]NDV81868.1 ABC transporter permease [Bacteroides sp. 51]
MIKHILKQIWNKRRANTWIFLELVLVTFFMWGVIDPVYVLLSNRAIPSGYNIDNVFRLTIGQYPSTHRKFREELNSDSIRRVNFLHMYNQVRSYDGVESAVITADNQYPLSESTSSTTVQYDSIQTSALIMSFYHDGDFFKVFRMHDINTGTMPGHRNPDGRTIYVTKWVEDKLTPGKSLVGKEIFPAYSDDTVYYEVKGIMPDFKFRSTGQPIRTQFIPLETLDVEDFPWSAQICFRIRDGLSKEVFAEQFKQEMASRLNVGNLYMLKLTDFDTIYRHSEFSQGVTNKLRLQISLATFFLICTFLGIAGTFWLRSDSRKGEIGLRMALGGTRREIMKEFLTESWLITTAAWILGIFFVLQRVYFTGFAEPPQFENDAYLQNRFLPHFLIVSLIVYALMLFIAVIGTLIPARQAAATLPSDALRNE